MNIVKKQSVSFADYSDVNGFKNLENLDSKHDIFKDLFNLISTLSKQGYTTFLSGLDEGFDMLAAEAVLKLKGTREAIELVAVVPFQGQELSYSMANRVRYQSLFQSADRAIFTSEFYSEDAYFVKDDFLLNSSACVVCHFDDLKSDSAKLAYSRASERGVSILHL